jgi:hypothetical protein
MKLSYSNLLFEEYTWLKNPGDKANSDQIKLK